MKTKTNIALIGYGKMGRAIERLAPEAGVSVVARVDPHAEWQELTSQAIQDAEVCIDFSHPDAIMENIRRTAEMGKSIVIGTTGWYQHLEEVREVIRKADTGALYAENFSFGVNLFLQIVEEAARLINLYPQYDVGCIESHHRAKVDTPSGTAQAIQKAMGREEVQIASLRCGSIPGTHSVVMDSAVDTITLTHEARNRDAFALGALQAAKWLDGRKGFYHFRDTMQEVKGKR